MTDTSDRDELVRLTKNRIVRINDVDSFQTVDTWAEIAADNSLSGKNLYK